MKSNKCSCYIGETESLGNPTVRQCSLCLGAPKFLEALQEIALGKGRYNQDPYIHCGNTVEDMKQLALDAIKYYETN